MNKWGSKRIAFISILIAMSISFVIIGTRFAGLTSFPSMKISLAGLPVKIIGYTFGPFIGFIIGFITDLISFCFMPNFYFPLYSLALAISGTLPGISAMFFNWVAKRYTKENLIKRLKHKMIYIKYKTNLYTLENKEVDFDKENKKCENISKKIDKINLWKREESQLNHVLIFGLVILSIVLVALINLFILIPQDLIDSALENKGILKLVSNKYIFILLIILGIFTCMIAIVIARFKTKKDSSFISFTTIVTFIVLTEYINIPIVSFADYKTIKVDFITSTIASLVTSIIKIWFNMIIITFAIRIVSPIIDKKTFNGYA